MGTLIKSIGISGRGIRIAWFCLTGVILGGFILGIALLNPQYALPEKAIQLIQTSIKQQKEIEESLKQYYQSENFTIQSPLVIQDPYRRAPLTALILFDSEQETQVQIDIPGKSKEATISFTFPEFSRHHEIPVLGLYPGANNQIKLTARTSSGEIEQAVIDLPTEPLPAYLMPFSVDKVVRDRYSPGFNFTFEDHKIIFDVDGAVRWFSPQSSFQVFAPLRNGRYLYTYKVDEDHVIFEQDLLGKIYAAYFIKDGIHHEILELPNGNLLITGGENRSGFIEDFLFELDPKNGHTIRSFDLKQYLDVRRPKEINTPDNDWLHLNSITYDPSDSSIIVSSRAQSAVIKFSYPEMQIKWILGPHDNWSEKYQPFLLTPVGDGFEWSWSQHHATLVEPAASSAQQLTIQLFDNALYRSFDPRHSYSPAESYSRVVRYLVDEKQMTVQQSWEYGKSRGSELFTHSASSAYVLSNGNILGTWGNITKDADGNPVFKNNEGSKWRAKIIEVDPRTNEVIFESTLDVMLNYRTFRADIYDRYAETQQFLSIPINDTTPLDLLDRWEWLNQDVKYGLEDMGLNLKRLARRIFDQNHEE